MIDPFLQAVEKIKDIAIEAVKRSYALQGHTLTGALIDSIEGKVKQTNVGATIDGYMLEYGVPVNTGVTAANIPYSPNSGNKFSRYIAGLQLFAELRFRVPKKEALSIAFAIAKKHKKEGMPSKSSKKYSRTGKRTGAIQEGLDSVQDEMQRTINEVITVYVQNLIIAVFKKNVPKVNIKR